MNNMQKLFNELGIKLYQSTGGEKPPWVLDCSAIDIYDLYAQLGSSKLAELAPKNHRHIKDKIKSDERDFWFGGSVKDFEAHGRGEIDLTPFLKLRDKLKDFRAKVQDGLSPVGRLRKRVLSEHDGEWMPERQWETQQFSSTKREMGGIIPTLRIDVDFSFHAGITSDDIAKYGAFCWAVCDSVESLGISTELVLQNTCDLRLDTKGGKFSKTNRRLEFNAFIKNAGAYVDTLSIARCFTPLFLRRGIFAAKYAAGDANGDALESSLSTPLIPIRNVSEPGRLFLRRETMQTPPEKLALDILSALQQKETVHA